MVQYFTLMISMGPPRLGVGHICLLALNWHFLRAFGPLDTDKTPTWSADEKVPRPCPRPSHLYPDGNLKFW